jgi:hypothetical protein
MQGANQRRNDDPDLGGGFGGWGSKIGAGLSHTREPVPILYERRPQDCKIFVNQTRLWLTDDVALQPENASHCSVIPKAYRPAE